jgi:hypothetical protein
MREQGLFDPARLVFIDETCTSTAMVRLKHYAPTNLIKRAVDKNMPKQTKPGAADGPGEQVVVRVKPSLLMALDAWCRAQYDQPTRAEALRRMASRVLAEDAGARFAKPRRPAKHS